MNLLPVILWLENGCNPKDAAAELRIYQVKLDNKEADAIKKEREECAKICEQQSLEPECPERAMYCADAIRMRSNRV